MPTSLSKLVSAPPSGRSRPVLLDSDEYALRVVRQGAPVPWLDLAALTGYVGQVSALLKSDATWVDVGALYDAHLDSNAELRTAMGARSRTGFALRTLLGDEQTASTVAATLKTLAESTRRPLVLDLPSPGRWVARAHAAAGKPVDSVDADAADSGSMYVAEWLGRVGGLPVALLLLDADEKNGDPQVDTEQLADYTAILNVAHHYNWSTALLAGDDVQVASNAGQPDPSVGVVPEGFWDGSAPAGDAQVLLSRVPRDAAPEEVLRRVAELS